MICASVESGRRLLLLGWVMMCMLALWGCTDTSQKASIASDAPVAVECSHSARRVAAATWTRDGGTYVVFLDLSTDEGRGITLEGRVGRISMSRDGSKAALTSLTQSGSGTTTHVFAAQIGDAEQVALQRVDEALWIQGLAWDQRSNRLAYGVLGQDLTRELRINSVGAPDGVTSTFDHRDLFGVWGAWHDEDRIYVREHSLRGGHWQLARLHPTTGIRSDVPNTEDFADAVVDPSGSRVALTQLAAGTRQAQGEQKDANVGLSLSVLEIGDSCLVSGIEGIVSRPAWSPDGRRLAVLQRSSEALKLAVLDVADWQPREMAQWGPSEISTSLAPFDWISDDEIVVATNGTRGPMLQVWSLSERRVADLLPILQHQK